MFQPENLEAYFERIHFRETPWISLDTLQGLHIGHCLNIPFENLDIHMGRKISLDPGDLFEKQVVKNRGGYCYEMNGLFACILETLGFPVTRMMARVLTQENPEPRNHKVLLVHVEGRDWLVDVGYGGRGLMAPIPMEHCQMERQFAETVRLMEHEDHWTLQVLSGEIWENQYEFTLTPHQPIDYQPGNYYQSTSPDSFFTRKILCTLPTTDGFIRLLDQELSITANGKTVRESAHSLDEYRKVLRKHFRLEPDGVLRPPWPQA